MDKMDKTVRAINELAGCGFATEVHMYEGQIVVCNRDSVLAFDPLDFIEALYWERQKTDETKGRY